MFSCKQGAIGKLMAYYHLWKSKIKFFTWLAFTICCLLGTLFPLGGSIYAGERTSKGNATIGGTRLKTEIMVPSWQLVWDRARQMAARSDTGGAIALYNTLLKERPGLVEARWEFAKLLMSSKDYSRAAKELERVVEARPHDLPPLYRFIQALALSNQCSRAASAYLSLLQKAPLLEDKEAGDLEIKGYPNASGQIEFSDLLTSIGRCFQAIGHPEEAVPYFEAVISLSSPQGNAMQLDLIKILMQSHNYTKAIGYFEKLYVYHKNDPDFLYNYSKALWATGDYQRAESILHRLLSKYLAKRPGKEGKNVSGQGLSHDKILWAENSLLQLLLMRGRIDEAIKFLQDLEKRDEMLDDDMLAALGRLYFADQRYLEAASVFRKIEKTNADNVEALQFLGRIYMKLQFYREAVGAYENLYFLKPTRENLDLLLKASIYYGRPEILKDLMTRFLPGVSDAGFRLLEEKLAIIAGPVTLQTIEQYMQASPGLTQIDPNLGLLRAAVFLLENKREAALDIVKRINGKGLDGLGEGRETRNLLQIIASELDAGKGSSLIDGLIAKQAERDPRWWYLDWLINSYIKQKRLDKAMEWAKKGVLFFPGSFRMQSRLADIALSQAETNASGPAVKILAAITRLNTIRATNTWIEERQHYLLGRFYLLEGRYEKSRDEYSKILLWAPDHIKVHRELMRLDLAMGLLPEAAAEKEGLVALTGKRVARMQWPTLINGKEVLPAPGIYVAQIRPLKDLRPPGDIIGAPFCYSKSEACQIYLALSFQNENDMAEALSAWEAFSKRHPYYWPAYEYIDDLLRVYENKGQLHAARKRACRHVLQFQANLNGKIPYDSAWQKYYKEAMEDRRTEFCM